MKEPEKFGLLMLERSARQGGHAVFKREMGKTILENQVRIATMLECEMDTSAHDINRVYFTTSSDGEDLLFLSPRLFQDAYDEATVLLKPRCSKREKDSDGRSFRKERTRRTSITSPGWKRSRKSRILRRF